MKKSKNTKRKQHAADTKSDTRKEAGYVIGENGKPVAPGVVCKCGTSNFCPAHGIGGHYDNNS